MTASLNEKHCSFSVPYLSFKSIFLAHMVWRMICRAQRKHQCKKRAVRQDWIEGIVLRHLFRLVKIMDLLEFIAENTYQYYLAQSTDTTYTKSLQKALDEIEPIQMQQSGGRLLAAGSTAVTPQFPRFPYGSCSRRKVDTKSPHEKSFYCVHKST